MGQKSQEQLAFRQRSPSPTGAAENEKGPVWPWLIGGGLCPPETYLPRKIRNLLSSRSGGWARGRGAGPSREAEGEARSAVRDGAPGCPGAPSTPTRPRNHPRVAWPPPGL